MKYPIPVSVIAAALLVFQSPGGAAETSADERALSELRNTVVNLLQGLVERGVLTREQAEQMVSAAQRKAEGDAAAAAARELSEQSAVRVPHVPEIVKDEIRKQVAADLEASVTKSVVTTAQQQGWGVPAALPEWIRNMQWHGDLRVRGQSDTFGSGNEPATYLDFQSVNEAGGIGKAGLGAWANSTEDRQRMRLRLRVGFDAALGSGWTLGARLATGSLDNPVSTNQNLGGYGSRGQVGVDLAYIDWDRTSRSGRHGLGLTFGKMENPWLSSELVWDRDLSFEGVAASYRFGKMGISTAPRYVFATVGAFPLQENEINTDKWLLGGQLGLDWTTSGGSRLRVGAALYDFRRISGLRNAFASNLLDYTAPPFVQRGNTMFDIRNDDDENNTNLFALAADYRVASATASFDWHVARGYSLSLLGEYVRNIGYDRQKVSVRTNGVDVPERSEGYQAEIGFGRASGAAGAWRAFGGYRYVERDAVVDAFTDSDFHLGGTDAQGFYFGAEYSLRQRVVARLNYMGATEIDGFPLAIDVLMLDLTASF